MEPLMRNGRLPLAGLILAIGFAGPRPAVAQSEVIRTQQENFRVVPVVEGLEVPWSMAWLPNGDMLVTERPGRLRLVRDGELQPNPITGTPQVRAQGQGGLLEVAVHPDFASNQFVYLTYSKPNADGSEGTTALIRARLEGSSLVDVEEIYEATAWSTRNGHFGSRLAIDRAISS
jgi:glucose/arabinose dehydrogenase